MSGLGIGQVNEAEQEKVQRRLSLTVMEPLQIAASFTAALEQQVASLQDAALAALANDQDMVDRLVTAAENQVILEIPPNAVLPPTFTDLFPADWPQKQILRLIAAIFVVGGVLLFLLHPRH